MSTQPTQLEALRLAEQYDHGDPAAHGNAWKVAVCNELRRLHALTTTQGTQPTDDEIEAAWTEATGSSFFPYPNETLAFARTVLAKWGTPQAVAGGEPVAEQFEAMHARGNVWITTLAAAKLARTAPPTQAVREPLTREQVKAIMTECEKLGAFYVGSKVYE